MSDSIKKMYDMAADIYGDLGVDVEKAMAELDRVPISIQCWQGDDVIGFENRDTGLTGGIATTGNYPGRARTPEELRADMEEALRHIPGKNKVSLHAVYLDTDEKPDRDEIEPKHFAPWVDWAKKIGVGLDFNPTFFSHPKSDDATLSSADESIRRFWIEHGKRSRKIAEYFGKETGMTCITNFWTPDGFKDTPADTMSPRMREKEALDEIFKEKIDPKYNKDAFESKVFGIGKESYTVGSNEFCTGYAVSTGNAMVTLDAGHFHPTEVISDKISALLCFMPELLLHVSRPVRWDSDHVVTFTDELNMIMSEIVSCNALDRVNIALDYFDASINRIAAWVIGTRNAKKALLKALLTPVDTLKKFELEGDFTSRLAMMEELKSYPFSAVWDYYCESRNVTVRGEWLKDIKQYEKTVLSKR